MKIIRLYVENFKKIKCVEITPNGDVIEVRGQNANGKTSALDAIWAALEWKSASKKICNPINNGGSNAVIEIDLGEYIVRRTFSEGSEKVTTKLQITRPNGDIVKKPQSILDGLIGEIAFDPMEFSRLRESDQRQVIADLAGLDLADYEAKRAERMATRRDTKKEIQRTQMTLDGIAPPTDSEPDQEISTQSVLADLQDVQNYEREVTQLQDAIDADRKKLGELIDNLKVRETLLHELTLNPPRKSAQSLSDVLLNLEAVNARAREITSYKRLKEAQKQLIAENEKLTAQIELLDIEKAEAIEAANLPIKNLSIDESGIKINGVEWQELSQAEKIKHSMAIAMASNPTLRVIRITDGSLLDAANMKVISEMAKDNDFQVWIEIVADSDNGNGIFLENGEVKID